MRHLRSGRKIVGSILIICLAIASIIAMNPQANANAAGYGIISTIAGSGSYSYSGMGATLR